MSVEKTLSIIKPDAVKRDLTGKIIAMFEEKGLRVVAQKKIWLSKEQAGSFYDVHRDRPFFGELCEFMSSGPIVVQVLEGNSAIELNREIMGATNPDQAEAGTIRKEFALSMTENSAHGSDSPETAREEISFFFSGLEILQFCRPFRVSVNNTFLPFSLRNSLKTLLYKRCSWGNKSSSIFFAVLFSAISIITCPSMGP